MKNCVKLATLVVFGALVLFSAVACGKKCPTCGSRKVKTQNYLGNKVSVCENCSEMWDSNGNKLSTELHNLGF